MLVEEEWHVAMRTRHYLISQCLDLPFEFAWMALYNQGHDTNVLNITSLTRLTLHLYTYRPAFINFLADLRVLQHTQTINKRTPAKTTLPTPGAGAHFVLNVGSLENSTMCMLFGPPPSTLSRTLRKAEKALTQALDGYKPARISWPSPSRQTKLAKLVEAQEPLLKHTFGFIDGKMFRQLFGYMHIQQPLNADLQNAMYNEWLHSVFVTGPICFASDGCIIWCNHKCPGSWNDSAILFEFRLELTDRRFCPDERMNVVSVSAFPCSTAMTGRILTPLKNADLGRILSSLQSSARMLHTAITSVRQDHEWGMGSIQKVFIRLNLLLPYDPELRGLRLNNLFWLANYRVRVIEIS
ncbi:hypothetical protein PHMEG_00031767, partial [Phytophthora megakarya]